MQVSHHSTPSSSCFRTLGSAGKEGSIMRVQPMSDLKLTINLPKTDFPMKANLPQNEPKWLERWSKMDLYGRVRKSRRNSPIFTLHDGPPYANGRIHLVTALNNILKDFIVKTRTLS